MLALATGARIVGDVMQVTSKDLGSAALVEERKVGKDKHMIFVEGCQNAKAVSIILHGVSEQFLEEMERALDDAFNVVTGRHTIRKDRSRRRRSGDQSGGKAEASMLPPWKGESSWRFGPLPRPWSPFPWLWRRMRVSIPWTR